MSRFGTLYHGSAEAAAAALEDQPATEQELRAALTNALNRIARLEEQIQRRAHNQKGKES